MKRLIWSLVFVVACVPMPGFEGYNLGHPTFAGDGHEWHQCPKSLGGQACQEGYSCVKDGCEWCGGSDGVENRCTSANDEYR